MQPLARYCRNIFFIFIPVLFCLQASAADTTTITINDVELTSVYYHRINFNSPTRLVFPNLRKVSGYIYFHQNVNLVDVSFPVLDSSDSYFYFHQNLTLKKLTAPQLKKVGTYLYIYGNTGLTQLDVCGLRTITPENETQYYSISNNTPAVDQLPFCFSQGAPTNLRLSGNTINENLPANTLVGNLSADSNPGDNIVYSLTDNFETDNNVFQILQNKLFSNRTFDYEVKNEYSVQLKATNQLGESDLLDTIIRVMDVALEDVATITIPDSVLSSVSYEQVNFTVATRLVFPNLRRVEGNIYFHKNVNLKSVSFPLLDSCNGYFYFHQNLTLDSLNAPNLQKVSSFLYVYGNSALTQLDVCALRIIAPENETQYYFIKNNTPAVDQTPFCFSQSPPANLRLSGNSISENLPPDTFVGDLAVDSISGSIIEYAMDNHQFDNNAFQIRQNKLFSALTFDYEVKNEYHLQIKATNQLGEYTLLDTIIRVQDVVTEDTLTITINDSVLTNISYHQFIFTSPTRLVFPNLRRVSETVYFHKNVNLVSVSFPVLDSCGGYFYFHQNLSLYQLKAPLLSTVTNYLYIHQNTGLRELDVCNLVRIRSFGQTEPYYFVRNNGDIDFASSCFRTTNVVFVPELNIVIQPVPYTFIGRFLPDVDTSVNIIRYFFTDSTGAETTNADFVIRADSVFLAREYSLYADSNFYFNVGAIRSTILIRRSTQDDAPLQEKIAFKVRMGIGNLPPTRNTWRGIGTTVASSVWENPANWTMNEVPDAYTDVEINSNNITVGSVAICRSLTVRNNAHVTIQPGCKLTVVK